MIQYFAIAATIIAACDAAHENFLVRTTEERIHSIDSDSYTRANLVTVDLYYAALCTDAMRFVNTQLVPVYEDLEDYMYVTYIPYGRGTHEKLTDENGTVNWNFTCQFGEQGCYGNKAHACAINQILTNPAIPNKQRVLVNFVGCAMSASNPALAVPECLATIGINATYIASVNTCIASNEGYELQAAYGNRTHALQPPLNFVPTIIINTEFSQENQNNALANFQGLVCQHIPVDSRPSVCSGSTPLHATRNVIAIAIASLILFIEMKAPNYLY